MTMNCNENRILDHFEGSLSEKEEQALIQHLESCPDCREIFNQYQVLFESIEQAPQRSTPEELSASVIGKIKRSTPRKFLHLAPWAAVAAVLMIGIVIIAHQNQQLTTLQGEIQELSSVVAMNAFDRLPASQRMEVLQMLNLQEEVTPDQIDMLMTTLQQDQNMNVRTSAALILAKHQNNTRIREFLYERILNQTDPYLRITLIRYLAENQDQEFIHLLHQLTQTENVMSEIRKEADKIIGQFQ